MSKRKNLSPLKEIDSSGVVNQESYDMSDMIQPFKKKNVNHSDRKEQRSKALAVISKFLNISDKYAKAWEKQRDKGNEVFLKTDNRFFNGSLRDYQETGVKWMETLFLSGINGILADEMGLGKTVQIIAFIGKLYELGVKGMHLISVPLSTVPNWMSEFERFAPMIPVILYHGSPVDREKAHQKIVEASHQSAKTTDVFPVLIVPHHLITKCISHFVNIKFIYLIIDEGHSIKNYNSQISQAVRKIDCCNKLLLTGTPLQNNMIELWSLLNFIMPHIFSNMETFNQLLQAEDLANETVITSSDSTTVVAAIQRVLRPFMLRRMKKDVLTEKLPMKSHKVYCQMSPDQLKLYTAALERDIGKLRGENKIDTNPIMEPRSRRLMQGMKITEQPKEPPTMMHKVNLNNPTMLYRQIVNHPYLVNAPLIPGTAYLHVDEELVKKSGKMRVLDAMLQKLLPRGHKVIIFSTFVVMIDLIGDYLHMRNIPYARLTGREPLEVRSEEIARFNREKELGVFLLSTRAGGQGINLTAADTVIFYDNDWNPHADLQAQARCHRIGQTRPVMVYTLISRNSIDEYILRTAELKLRLEKAIMQEELRGRLRGDTMQKLLDFLRKGKDDSTVYSNGLTFSDEQLEELLDRTELEKQMVSSNVAL